MKSCKNNSSSTLRRTFLGELFLIAIGGITGIMKPGYKPSSRMANMKKEVPDKLYPAIHPQAVARKNKIN